MQQLVLDRINTIRPQLPPDATVTLGPNASSMGWIYQYALVDQRRTARPARTAPAERKPDQARAADGAGHRRSRFGRRAGEAIPAQDFSAAAREGGHFAAGRSSPPCRMSFRKPADARSRSPTATTSCAASSTTTTSTSWNSLVVGRSSDGKPVSLKDVGYIQVGYDQRRSTVDLDGNGEVVGGIVIMEQDQNVLAVTRSLEQKLQQIAAPLPAGHRDRHDLRSVGLDLGHAQGVLRDAGYRAGRGDPRDDAVSAERARRGRPDRRSCCSASLFTALPLAVSTRPSTCSRSRVCASPSARSPTRRS